MQYKRYHQKDKMKKDRKLKRIMRYAVYSIYTMDSSLGNSIKTTTERGLANDC